MHKKIRQIFVGDKYKKWKDKYLSVLHKKHDKYLSLINI